VCIRGYRVCVGVSSTRGKEPEPGYRGDLLCNTATYLSGRFDCDFLSFYRPAFFRSLVIKCYKSGCFLKYGRYAPMISFTYLPEEYGKVPSPRRQEVALSDRRSRGKALMRKILGAITAIGVALGSLGVAADVAAATTVKYHHHRYVPICAKGYDYPAKVKRDGKWIWVCYRIHHRYHHHHYHHRYYHKTY
jgi:hypothetical protein